RPAAEPAEVLHARDPDGDRRPAQGQGVLVRRPRHLSRGPLQAGALPPAAGGPLLLAHPFPGRGQPALLPPDGHEQPQRHLRQRRESLHDRPPEPRPDPRRPPRPQPPPPTHPPPPPP